MLGISLNQANPLQGTRNQQWTAKNVSNLERVRVDSYRLSDEAWLRSYVVEKG